MSIGWEFYGGTALVLLIVVVAGRRLRRPGSPKGPTWRNIAIGAVLFVVAGGLYTLPPHNVIFAVLAMLLGCGFFVIGIATLGGGYFGFLGAAAAGMAAVPWMMTPTPLLLSHVGRTVTCKVRNYDGTGVQSFTADCPDGHSHDMSSGDYKHFPNGQVQLIVDPNNVLPAEFAGPLHVTTKVVASILCLLGASGIVVAAAVNNRRLRGAVPHVAKPGFSSGP
ncbi:hypothetical protein [Kribbella sp.]|uniref:hypothetical protein n=1 Tax=Kribbella sp. TaxID=1871183 RepID=UPI002D5409D2|nr:hypothetical protein [Kribbella sp.]HZX02526.1 hypothetical protein [Kribbella sp.]